MTLVPLTEVVFDESIYPRSTVNAATVEKYAEAISVGDVFPAIVVESDSNRLLDGKHRLDAHRQLGLADIEVEFVDIPEGMHPRLFCASLSSRHGLPLPDNDAADLARALYESDPDLSVTAVAKALGRARKTVDGWLVEQRETRREIEEREREVRRYVARLLLAFGWTQVQVADHFGVTQQSIQTMAKSPLSVLDEGVLREAVLAAPVDVAAVAEGWREDRMFSTWSDEERLLLKRLRAGETVVVNMRDEDFTMLSRVESWRLAADRSLDGHPNINESFDVVSSMPAMRRPLELRHAVVDSIESANARRLSLAIVHPTAEPELFFDHNPESPDSPELRLFDLDDSPRHEFGAKRFAYIPRLRFSDAVGEHRLMLRDWGTFEFMRRYGDARRHELPTALHLSKNVSLLLGNLANQRNAWIIISVLNGIRQDTALTLFEDVA